MGRPAVPQYKKDIIKKAANLTKGPGGAHLLRDVLAPGLAAATDWKQSTVCKYVEQELGRHPFEVW